jgi:hypothetical protein
MPEERGVQQGWAPFALARITCPILRNFLHLKAQVPVRLNEVSISVT